jgi:methionyl-tRNA formyltransferase
MSIVFIGTPEFAVPSLRRLAQRDYNVAAVFTQPDRPAGRGRHLTPPPVKAAATELGIPVRQPEALRDPAVVGELRDLQPEAIVVVAYSQILRQDVLDIPSKGVLNLHPSLLPRWRGPSPIPAAILAGDAETGVTIMLMDAGMDSGAVLSQRRKPLSPHDTTGSLTASLSDAGADLLAETLGAWLNGDIQPRPQDDALATVSRLIRKEDGAIDWQEPADMIWRRVRAYNPWPSAHSWLDKDPMRIWKAWPLEENGGEPPGTVVRPPAGMPEEAKDAAFTVQTGVGLLAVLEAQRADRRALPSAEFLRGMPGLIGKRLTGPPE